MGLYEGIKDVAKVLQQADNVELYMKLLDLCAQALDLQEENMKLREEVKELKYLQDLTDDIEYHVDAFVTRKSDTKPIRYCAACWAGRKILVPLQNIQWDNLECPLCKARVIDKSNW